MDHVEQIVVDRALGIGLAGGDGRVRGEVDDRAVDVEVRHAEILVVPAMVYRCVLHGRVRDLDIEIAGAEVAGQVGADEASAPGNEDAGHSRGSKNWASG